MSLVLVSITMGGSCTLGAKTAVPEFGTLGTYLYWRYILRS